MKTVNYEVLNYLRERKGKDLYITERIYLYFKLKSIKADLNELFNSFNEIEGTQGVDYGGADKYEYDYRYRAYQRGLTYFYQEIGDGVGLDLFTDRVISDSLKHEKQLKLRRG